MSTKKQIDVLAIGEAMVEFNQKDQSTYLRSYGGDTSNCVIAASRMGAATAYVTQLGDDLFGDELMSVWAQENVDSRYVKRLIGAETGLYFVSHGVQGHQFSYRRSASAASQMRPDILLSGAVESAKWLHCSGISQAISASACDTVFDAIDRAKASGTLISYDLNYRSALWPAPRALAVAQATLAHCDLFFPSIDEVTALTGLTDPQDVLAWSHQQGAKMVALKMGARGSLVSTAAGVEFVAPYEVNALDATGAGDCYAGAVLARLSAGDSIAIAARAGNVAAALSTLGYGALAPLPRWRDVQALL